MTKNWIAAIAAGAALALAGVADARELQLYNWGNYTSPEMLAKFEAETGIKVTVTDYDSNDTALAKVKAGGHGFDMVVPSANYVPIWIAEGLVLEARPDEMPNFANVDPRWVDVSFDQGRKYSVPWQWGVTGVSVNKSIYAGDPNTWGVVFDAPAELAGKINVLPEMNDIIHAAIFYNGGEACTTDPEVLKKVRDTLVEAKPSWLSLDYGNVEKYAKVDLAAGTNWNGASMRSRLQNPDVVFGYPKEGYILWMDNLMILKDAKNVEEAKEFMNFVMAPENAAMISDFAKYANGIAGSEAFLPEEMKGAPELTIPAGFEDKGHFLATCSPEATEMYTAIWTEVNQ